MSDIHGIDSSSPDKGYQVNFRKSAELFEQALDGYHESDNAQQKAHFKLVMDETLDVMNKTAKVSLSEQNVPKEKQLGKDYDEYMKSDNDQNYQKVKSDIDEIILMVRQQ